MRPGNIILYTWVAWVISWVAAAWWSDNTESQPSSRQELGYRVVNIIGALIIAIPAHGYEGAMRVWHVGWLGGWVCAVVVAIGVAIAWWARIYLGRLWSARVTQKTNHQVIDSGPYAFVRHPIYTGLLLSLLATVIAKGTIPALVGFIVIAIGIYLKARLEERWLSAELGADAYDDYRRRVPMLLPTGATRKKPG